MLESFNVTQLSPGQIAEAFIIVIACIFFVGKTIPVIKDSLSNLRELGSSILFHATVGEKNKEAITNLNAKLDSIADLVNNVLEESKRSDERLSVEIDKVRSEINNVQEELNRQKIEKDKDKIDAIRAKILSFASTLKVEPDRLHSEKEFQRIIESKRIYDSLIEKYNLTNGVMETEYKFICDTYKTCSETGKLLFINNED